LFQTAPGTGELVVFGVDAIKPYMEVGVVSGIYSFSLLLTPSTKVFPIIFHYFFDN
jgi:hypothetical protein